jgi:hypothetical protein
MAKWRVILGLLWALPASAQYIDFLAGSSPGNPGSGLFRLWANNSTGFLECLTAGGGACLTKIAVPAPGQIPVGNAGGTAYAPQTVTGDASLTSAGVITNSKINGTSVPTNSAADQTLVTTASATGSWVSIANCVAAGGVIQYATATHTFSCHTLVAGDIPTINEAFNNITSGTNTAAKMIVGAGATLGYNNSFTLGTVTANNLACFTASNTVGNCTGLPSNNAAGVFVDTSGNIQSAGVVTVTLDATVNVAFGDILCASPISAGTAHDNANLACTPGEWVGIVQTTAASTALATAYLKLQ